MRENASYMFMQISTDISFCNPISINCPNHPPVGLCTGMPPGMPNSPPTITYIVTYAMYSDQNSIQFMYLVNYVDIHILTKRCPIVSVLLTPLFDRG